MLFGTATNGAHSMDRLESCGGRNAVAAVRIDMAPGRRYRTCSAWSHENRGLFRECVMAGSAADVNRKAADLGKLAVRMTASSGSGHPSSALSLAHVVTHLMFREMRHDPANPWHGGADRLVLSEGHAVPIVYAAWADLDGMIGKSRDAARALTRSELDQLRALGSELDGHPNPAEGFPFFDAATGSLGMGLSVAAGLALAARLDSSERRVFCIVGDGESREGQIWEAVDFIADHKLTGICTVFNCNGQGQAGFVSAQQSPERIADKLRAAGWEVVVIDGHNVGEIEAAFAKFGRTTAPLGIVAKTVKGWGVDELLKGNWHGKPLTMAQLESANASLDRAAGGTATGATFERPKSPAKFSKLRDDPREAAWPSFSEVMEAAGLGGALQKGQLSTRRAYGAALKAAGKLLPQVVALDADVSNSTFSEMFRDTPECKDRFFECKIAEQNMVSVAAGFSAAGFIPFANSFSKFLSRAYDQIELASISRANIKLVGSHSGISLAADGPSQMSLNDVAFFRAFTTVRGDDRETPLCWLYQPSDSVSAFQLTRLMTQQRGMCYMRTHRPDVPLLYSPDTKFEPRGFQALSSGGDLAIVSCGYMVHVAKQALALLEKQNRRATLIDAYCLPIDRERLTEALLRAGGRAIVVEDNYGAGLGGAVAEVAAAHGGIRVTTVHVNRIPKSARTAEEILDYCGVGAGQIADHAMAMLTNR